MCPVCGEQGESLFHAFFVCKFSREVWRCSSLDDIQVDPNIWEGLDGWNGLLQWHKGKDLLDTWMLTTWQIWNNRNQCLHNFIATVSVNNSPAEVMNSIGWSPLPVDSYKLNVDAAFDTQSNNATLGMVVRDHLGSIKLYAVKRVTDID